MCPVALLNNKLARVSIDADNPWQISPVRLLQTLIARHEQAISRRGANKGQSSRERILWFKSKTPRWLNVQPASAIPVHVIWSSPVERAPERTRATGGGGGAKNI